MSTSKRSPWFWVPTLYYAEGIPYIVAMAVSVIMYKRLGISNADIALYTSWLYLPWVIKPLWSPVVDIFKTKRFWIVIMQLFIGASMASIALTIPVPNFFQFTLAFFWLMAFSSATHDIAADGFYMLGLNQHQQAWFVGVRSTFYRFAMITGQGLLVILAGFIESNSGLESVELTVRAAQANNQVQQQMMHPDSLNVSAKPGDLRIITYPDEQLVVPLLNISPDSAASLKEKIKEWNRVQGQVIQQAENQQKDPDRESWWKRHVTDKLAAWIKRNFAPAKETLIAEQKAGNIGVIYFYLSKAPEPGETVAVTFGRESGDKSIMLELGQRIEFDEKNWNQPAMALVQLDPKLKTATVANFVARAGNIPLAWILTFSFMAVLFVIFSIYHKFILPHPKVDVPRQVESFKKFGREFLHTFALFFKKEHIGISIAFLLLYRLGESQLVKLAMPFMLDTQEAGGLGLTTGQVGFVYGTIGMLMLTAGGLLGGFVAARHGLKAWIWFMAIAMNLPNITYIYLSQTIPDNFWIINACVGIEQFGYGFGFTAYMLYMIYVSEGDYKTSHFAITTGFMALGMMLPGMISGWIQELVGYPNFFIWVLLATIPGFIIIYFLPLDPNFGKKREQ
jgi:PAT family beta-lactamase induction signal transducer AmpG